MICRIVKAALLQCYCQGNGHCPQAWRWHRPQQTRTLLEHGKHTHVFTDPLLRRRVVGQRLYRGAEAALVREAAIAGPWPYSFDAEHALTAVGTELHTESRVRVVNGGAGVGLQRLPEGVAVEWPSVLYRRQKQWRNPPKWQDREGLLHKEKALALECVASFGISSTKSSSTSLLPPTDKVFMAGTPCEQSSINLRFA